MIYNHNLHSCSPISLALILFSLLPLWISENSSCQSSVTFAMHTKMVQSQPSSYFLSWVVIFYPRHFFYLTSRIPNSLVYSTSHHTFSDGPLIAWFSEMSFSETKIQMGVSRSCARRWLLLSLFFQFVLFLWLPAVVPQGCVLGAFVYSKYIHLFSRLCRLWMKSAGYLTWLLRWPQYLHMFKPEL